MKEHIAKLLKIIGFSWAFALIFIVASILEGVVLSFLWEWFIVTLGVRPISIFHAIGLCVLLDFLTYHYYDYKRSEEAGLTQSLTFVLIRPTVAFVLGYALHFAV